MQEDKEASAATTSTFFPQHFKFYFFLGRGRIPSFMLSSASTDHACTVLTPAMPQKQSNNQQCIPQLAEN